MQTMKTIVSNDGLIFDDESVSKNQHILPRMIGGGRTLGAEYNYECLWCPKEVIQTGRKGRYKELRNYRDHFTKCHLGEEGNGIPMTEFLQKVHRCEPTWFCTNCKTHYSLGNVVRHKAICRPEQQMDGNESGSEANENMSYQGKQKNVQDGPKQNKRKKSLSFSNQVERESYQVEHEEDQLGTDLANNPVPSVDEHMTQEAHARQSNHKQAAHVQMTELKN